MSPLYWGFLAALVALASSQETLDPDLIKEIFGTPLENFTVTPTTGPTTVVDADGGSCVCVPYYLCNPDDSTIMTDGTLDGFGIIDIRFRPENCQESVEVCCKNPRDATDPIKTVEHPERLRGCGVRNTLGVDFQITGAPKNEAEFGEFPWTVAILNVADSSAICVGSLIHPQVVMTGAHCVNGLKPNTVKIRAGEWDTQTTKERLPYQERAVGSFIVHPQFNPKVLSNDIALVVLAEPVTLADNINTICLPPQDENFENAKSCYATGWGKTNFGKEGRYAVIMKRIELDTVDYNKCQQQFQRTRLGPRFKLHRTFLCAGGQKGKDTCQGDGGAPFACPTSLPDRYQQAGIVAWGIGCGQQDVPAAYTYVSKYRTWVDGHMQQLGFNPSSYILA